MPRPELALDHVTLLVRRLDRTAQAFERMGFGLSAQLSHEGQLEPGGRIVAWGTAGRCITLDHGYLELMAATGGTEYGQDVARRAKRREGIHLVAFGTPDLSDLRADLGPNVPGIEAPVSLVREWPAGSGSQPAAFRMAHLDGRAWPEADLVLIEHRSRDVVWHPSRPVHVNGATALAFVVLAVQDVGRSRERFARLLGPAAGSTFRLGGGGRLTVTDLVGVVRRYPGAGVAEAPFPAALGIRVAELRLVESILVRNQVPHQRTPNDTIWVGPAEAGGCIIEFVAETVPGRERTI
ncbi:VOC family protein [Geminicoccus roseus]|uniref:VOC family protein n=1 Tax=Geminicoccus roseus TaxID=404900 RepID=UPI0004201F92|nr:VOC family protein [Geminicoccus roseus]